MLKKVQDDLEMNLVSESIINGLQQKKANEWQAVMALNEGENKTDPVH